MAGTKREEKETKAAAPEVSKVEFAIDGEEYVLEFDRASVARAEKVLDLTLTDVMDGKVSMYPTLFKAALIKNHPGVTLAKADELAERIIDKTGLYQVLATLYIEGVNAILEDPKGGNGVSWTAL